MPRLHPGIKAKTAFAVTLCVSVALLVFGFVQSALLRDDMKEQIGAQQLRLLERMADDLDHHLSLQQEALVRAAANLPIVDMDDANKLKSHLANRDALMSLFDTLTIIDAAGKVLAAHGRPDLVGMSVVDRPYYKATVESRRPQISQPVLGKSSREPLVGFTAPILTADGEFRGMLYGSIHLLKPNFLGSLINEKFGVSGHFHLLSLDRKILIGANASRIMLDGPPPGQSAYFDDAMTRPKGWIEAVSSMTKRHGLFTFKRLNNVPWVLVAMIPVEEAFAPIARAQQREWWKLAALLLILPIAVWLLVRRQLAPLSDLRDGMRQLRQSPNTVSRLPMAHEDEIGDVAREFNRLTLEQRVTEMALRESETRLRGITDHIPALIAYMDAEERYCFINQTCKEWYGHEPSDYLGKPLSEMIGPEAYATLFPYLKRAYAGKPSIWHREIVDPGRERSVEGRYIPDFADDGSVRGIFVLVSDVTPIKKAERRALENSAKLGNLIESARDAIVTVNGRQQVEIFNAAAQEMFGYAPEDVIGQEIDKLIPERFRQHHAALVSRFVGGGADQSNMNRAGRTVLALRSDGTEFPVEASISRSNRGAQIEYTVIMRDVTEKMRIAAELEAGAELLRRTVENMPMGVVVLDANVNLLAFNDRFLEFMDLPRGKFAPGDSLEKVIRYHIDQGQFAGVDVEEMIRTRLDLARNNQEHCFEHIRPDGAIIEVRGLPVPGGGVVRVYTDVTARREEARKLNEARENAEATARAKSEFLATMSHEVRTPMNGVLGIAELLHDTPLNPEQHDYVDTILRSGHALMEILNDILDLSKIEAGKLSLEAIACDPVQTISDTVTLLAPRASEKGLLLQAEISPDVPRDVMSDPGRLRQVLFNLVGNAIKFTDRGAVHLALNIVEAGPDDVVLSFSVKDSGIGLSETQRARLFQPFTQADASTTRRFGGTGLGLAICKRLVEMMGGEIAVESQAGAGSTFTFSVRCKRAPLGSSKAAQSLGDTGRSFGGRVLLVEDNVVNRKVASSALNRVGIEVVTAENGSLAVEAVKRETFDLVLMDMHMPVMDGLEATRQIRALKVLGKDGQRLPIVAMTANVLQEAVQSCREAGMDDYLAKPFTRAQLTDLLSRWLNEGVSRTVQNLLDVQFDSGAAASENAATRAPEKRAIDTKTYRQLAHEMEEDMPVLMDEFINGARETFALLEDASGDADPAAVVRSVHTLKSTAATVGAMQLSELARVIEARLKAGDGADLAVAGRALQEEFARVEEALHSLEATPA